MPAVRQDLRCLPPFAPAYAHYTRGLARFVCTLSAWMTLQELAAVAHLSWDTVKQIVQRDLARRYKHIALKGVRYLAVDEFHVGKKGKFMTVALDLDSGQILHVAKGRGAAALQKFFRRLRLAKAKVQAVACDMSAAYWSAILQGLPKAKVVFDHFHIIKLANEQIDDLRRSLQREAAILERRYLKGTRYLLMMGAENVPEGKRAALQEALRFNEPLSMAYYLKEELRELWQQSSHAEAKRWLHGWCEQAVESGIAQMISLAKTMRMHASGILNYFLHPISTGPLEGINHKIKTLKRKAYGYRDQTFFILKLFSLHESKFVFTGC
jgi:transposase